MLTRQPGVFLGEAFGKGSVPSRDRVNKQVMMFRTDAESVRGIREVERRRDERTWRSKWKTHEPVEHQLQHRTLREAQDFGMKRLVELEI